MVKKDSLMEECISNAENHIKNNLEELEASVQKGILAFKALFIGKMKHFNIRKGIDEWEIIIKKEEITLHVPSLNSNLVRKIAWNRFVDQLEKRIEQSQMLHIVTETTWILVRPNSFIAIKQE